MIKELYIRLAERYVNFYGVYDFQFKIGSITLEAYIEDGKVKTRVVNPVRHMSILPVARVKLVERHLPYNTFDGYALVDEDGKEWLHFGVSVSGDFVFDSYAEQIETILDNILQG